MKAERRIPGRAGWLVPTGPADRPRKERAASGFTLVEMLVVIAILGILMAMMVPAAGLILRRAKESTAKSDAGIVVTVMQKYHTEYNRWPGLMDIEDRHYTDNVWVDVMNPTSGGTPSEYNLKRVMFFEPGGGALGTDLANDGFFVDPWGNAFEYQVDENRDGVIPEPDTGDSLRAGVIAWSAGPDGDYDTWEDNIKGWE